MRHMMETFKGHWACPNGYRLLSESMRRHRNSILNRFFLKTSFHAFLTFIYFCYLFDSLALVSCCFLCLLILILSGLFRTCIWNIQWRWSLYVHILWGLSCDSSPICKKLVRFLHTFTLLMTIQNALWSIRILYSLTFFLTIYTSLFTWKKQNGWKLFIIEYSYLRYILCIPEVWLSYMLQYIKANVWPPLLNIMHPRSINRSSNLNNGVSGRYCCTHESWGRMCVTWLTMRLC